MTDLATLGIRVQTGDLKDGATALSTLTARGKQAEKATHALGAASRTAGSSVAAFGTQMNAASGSTANLVAQFNDIGVMMAAGQNPLQLALQQGTQINQVFAQLGGGREAIRAVGAAFMSLLSPINLATIGIITFGGMAVNWLMQARGEAESLDEATDRLGRTLNSLQTAADMAGMSMYELAQQYGDNAEAARNNLMEILALERAIASQGLRDAINSLRDVMDGMFRIPSGQGSRATILRIAKEFGISTNQVKILSSEVDALKSAMTFDEQNAAIENIGRVFADMGVPLDKLPRSLLEGLRAAAGFEDIMLALEAAISGSADEPVRLAHDPRADKAKRIFEETRTAAERYAIELADLNELQRMGYLDAETYGRAVDALADQFDTGSDLAASFGRSIASLGADMVLNLGKGENAVKSLLYSLARLATNTMFQKFVAPGLEAGLQGVVEGLGGIFGGARADGGPVSNGRTYLVGERGPELFTPSSSGGIIPNHAMGDGARGEPVQVVVRVLPSGEFDARVQNTARAVVRVEGPRQIGAALSRARETRALG